uniref:Waterborne settlement pheromone-like protein 5 n=1 Tax=Amphibalanus improvisus TaxID=1220549 RepID=A0A4Y5QZV3_AMPIM|nr:waterborne settlement pheromone-like protein 5 [Amphibalanus improvisus]
MRLLLFVCVCALAAAQKEPQSPQTPSLTANLTTNLTANLSRQENVKLLPKDQQLKDALEIKWDGEFLAGPAFYSPHNATFEGTERTAFSFINFLINPGQCGHLDDGSWVKNDVSEVVFMYHSGAPVKVHFISEGGVYSTKVMGNPLDLEGAQFLVHVPRAVYSAFESLSNTQATFHSYIDIPAWSADHHQEFTPADMAAIFPQYSGLFEHLAKPGYQGEWTQ